MDRTFDQIIFLFVFVCFWGWAACVFPLNRMSFLKQLKLKDEVVNRYRRECRDALQAVGHDAGGVLSFSIGFSYSSPRQHYLYIFILYIESFPFSQWRMIGVCVLY